MFHINNKEELIAACNNLEKLVETEKTHVEIIFDVSAVTFWDQGVQYFVKYFEYISKITNNNFFIRLLVPRRASGHSNVPMLENFIRNFTTSTLKKIVKKIKCLSFMDSELSITDEYFTRPLLNKLNYLNIIEFRDMIGGCMDPVRAPKILDIIHEFCKDHPNIQEITFLLSETDGYIRACVQHAEWESTYSALQNTLLKNKASLDKLDDCIKKTNELQKAIKIYKERLLEQNTIEIVRNNDKQNFEEISAQLEQVKQNFKKYSEILIMKNNLYVYYYLVKYQIECEENHDYKQMFEYLDKITFPLESDPEKDKHADSYYKAKMWQASMCLDKSQYAQIEGLDLKNLDKDENGEYIFSREIEAERIKLVIKYALEAKQESGNLAESVLQEYILGTFVSSTENDFADISSKDKNAFDVIWQLVEAFKKYVENHKKDTKEQETQTEHNSILIFMGRGSKQQTEATTESEETNPRKRPRNRSASYPRL